MRGKQTRPIAVYVIEGKNRELVFNWGLGKDKHMQLLNDLNWVQDPIFKYSKAVLPPKTLYYTKYLVLLQGRQILSKKCIIANYGSTHNDWK